MKLINVKLKGWNDKTDKDPIIKGNIYKVKKRLFNNFLFINKSRIFFF